jgi:hypothetical protein
LAGPVVGDIPAPVGEDDLDSLFLDGLGSEDVMDFSRLSHRNHRWVLQEQQNIPNFILPASLRKTILQAQRIFIIDIPQEKSPAGRKIFWNPNHEFKLSSEGVEVKEVGVRG